MSSEANFERPDPPFVEYHFYKPWVDPRDLGGAILRVLFEDGARASGAVVGSDNTKSGLNKKKIELDNDAVFGLLEEPMGHLDEVRLKWHRGDLIQPSHILRFSRISEAAREAGDVPLVYLAGSGEVFFGPPEIRDRDKEQRTSIEVFERFLHLLLETSPGYASITVEYGPRPLRDQKDEPQARAFNNFYASRRLFGDDGLSTIANIAEEAYLLWLPGGFYVSMSGFNPSGKRTIAPERARKLAGEIADYVSREHWDAGIR